MKKKNEKKSKEKRKRNEKQGRIHGKTVADGWAGAVMQQSLAIIWDEPTDYRTDRLTGRHG